MRSITSHSCRSLPEIPVELWAHIFSFLSDIRDVIRSDASTWADITRSHDVLYTYRNPRTRERLAGNIHAKLALNCVSKLFRQLAQSILLEHIVIRTPRGLAALCRSAASSPEFAGLLTQYTQRLDVTFGFGDEESTDEAMMSELLGKGWIRDVELVLRACPKLKFISWDALDKSYAPVDLFLVLPTTCPEIEVLLWRCQSHIETSVLSQFSNLRVFYLDSSCLPTMGECAAINLPSLHTLGSSVSLVTDVLHQSRMPKLRTLLMDDTRRQHLRFAFLTIHGMKITSLRNLSLLSTGLPFDSLCPNLTDLVVRLEDIEELTRMRWPRLKHLGIHLARAPQRLDVETLLFVLGQVENSRSEGKFCELEEIRIMDASLVRRVQIEASMAARLIHRRISGWRICLLGHEGGLLLPSHLTT